MAVAMCPLYDGIMSGSYGPPRASPVCYQTIPDFFNLFFPLATPEGPGASAETSSEGQLSRIYGDLPHVADCLLTNELHYSLRRLNKPTSSLCTPWRRYRYNHSLLSCLILIRLFLIYLILIMSLNISTLYFILNIPNLTISLLPKLSAHHPSHPHDHKTEQNVVAT